MTKNNSRPFFYSTTVTKNNFRPFFYSPSLFLFSIATWSTLSACADSAKERPSIPNEPVPIVVKLGEPLPLLPMSIDVGANAPYARWSDIVEARGAMIITMELPEGKQVRISAAYAEFWRMRDRLSAVSIVPTLEPRRFLETVDALKAWLAEQQIEPDQYMAKVMATWREDRPGNEGGPRYLPRHERAISRITEKSQLAVYLQPHPERGWVLRLHIAISADEMWKLRFGEDAVPPGRRDHDAQ